MTSSPDLPAIGRPATAALELAGITTLRQVAGYRAQDLLALHGVGPKAVRILAGALAAEGLTFRGG
jgi:predicted flap endonuclease-1-like 5' DNA nuclease